MIWTPDRLRANVNSNTGKLVFACVTLRGADYITHPELGALNQPETIAFADSFPAPC